MKTKIVMSIVSHGQQEEVFNLLSSISTHVDRTFVDLNIVVRDNINEGLSFEFDSLNIHVVANTQKLGFGQNHNLTFCDFPCDVFIVLNPDLIFIDALDLSSLLVKKDEFMTATLLKPNGSMYVNVRPDLNIGNLIRRRLGFEEVTAGYPRWVSGAFLVFNWETFAAVGGFDEFFHMYVEDCDLCMRLQENGYSLTVNENLMIMHEGNFESNRRLRPFLNHLRSIMYYLVKKKINFLFGSVLGRYLN